MPLLQPRLNLKVSQRQILTPGLMQMVSVLALNKLELKEMIQAEIAENPVLEEMEETVPLLDDVAREEEQRERPVERERGWEERRLRSGGEGLLPKRPRRRASYDSRWCRMDEELRCGSL